MIKGCRQMNKSFSLSTHKQGICFIVELIDILDEQAQALKTQLKTTIKMSTQANICWPMVQWVFFVFFIGTESHHQKVTSPTKAFKPLKEY